MSVRASHNRHWCGNGLKFVEGLDYAHVAHCMRLAMDRRAGFGGEVDYLVESMLKSTYAWDSVDQYPIVLWSSELVGRNMIVMAAFQLPMVEPHLAAREIGAYFEMEHIEVMGIHVETVPHFSRVRINRAYKPKGKK